MSERRRAGTRRRPAEERDNHEAWAISYADLITLLLAFFVVMYAISSVNAGKYRVLSDSLNAAFRGTPKSMEPVQVGEKQRGSGADIQVSIVQQKILAGQPRDMLQDIPLQPPQVSASSPVSAAEEAALKLAPASLETMQGLVEQALAPLIQQKLVTVRRTNRAVEVEIRADILFASGSATLAPQAEQAIRQLAAALRGYTNPVRVEGHTDNIPIKSLIFPSNWELSSARAASVVRVLAAQGVDPAYLAVLGFAEFRPIHSNDTVEGRNANRRVLIVILGADSVAPTPVARNSSPARRP